MLDLEEIQWGRDVRKKKPDAYIAPIDCPSNRINFFLKGWEDFLCDRMKPAKTITWRNLGRIYASILGDIPLQRRRKIYSVLLAQFVFSPSLKSWSKEDRAKAMSFFYSPDSATQISNQELDLRLIPTSSAEWEEIGRFALTFNGYAENGSFEACAQIANAQMSRTLSDLRTCLFFEQRRWHHFGDTPDRDSMEYVRHLVELIREKVAEQQLE